MAGPTLPPLQLPGAPRVALVHDWLTGYRGGEKVLRIFAELLPQAELYTLFHVPGSSHPAIERLTVHASWMNRLPASQRYYRWLLPLFPAWADRLDLSGYDLVISTSHCVAKGVRAPRGVHVCYCFTPMRYVWDSYDTYFGHLRGPRRALVARAAERLRRWDRATAARVDRFVAISRCVQERIVRCYGVPAERVEILPAPVDLQGLGMPLQGTPRTDRYLIISALVPYKRVDVAVEACARSGRRLTVAGSGPELPRLQRLARALGAADRIDLLGAVSDAQVAQLLRSHRAFLFPGVEDFGLTPIEAAACGLPVIALAQGGVLDTMIDGVTAQFYEDASPCGLAAALDRFEREGRRFDPQAMHEHARRFSPQRFASAMGTLLQQALAGTTARQGAGVA
jgi:glycosyltransferase involved in cell wall biosynthesis